MKVLVTGAAGQLGRSLLETVPDGFDVTGVDRAQCDVGDAAQCLALLAHHRPDVVINAAAYTQVDKAEVERDQAFRINADGPAHLADASGQVRARLVHVSTDFVFDGQQGKPYSPSTTCHPLNVYGASKRAGEERVLARLGDRAVVMRTAWVYSRHGGNFVKTMLRLMATRDSVSVVSDQVGSPTWARSLALAAWAAAARPEVHGILHWTDAGAASWYDFAVAIEEEAVARGLLPRRVPVLPIASEDYARQFPASVPRPSFSVLDLRATRAALGLAPVHWRIHLRAMLDELNA